jgi:hypothetical protein
LHRVRLSPHKVRMKFRLPGKVGVGSCRASRHVGVCIIAFFVAGAQTTGTCADDSIAIELIGDIEPECRLTALPGSVNLGALTKTGTQFIPFQVNCNAPFNYSVRSREGALKTGALNVPPGFVVKIPYSLETRIPTNEGLIIDQCGSATLAMSVPSCGHGGSGSAIAIEQIGSLMISWAISDELVVGTYTDVVTLSVSPRL